MDYVKTGLNTLPLNLIANFFPITSELVCTYFFLFAFQPVLSRINVLRKIKLFEPAEVMKKLNQRKINWIVREMKRQELTVCRIARQQNITPRHARRVFEKYKGIAR